MATAQFKGIENVVEAYEQRDVPAFAIFQGKQFLFPFADVANIQEGADSLREILQKLSKGANVLYTIKVYEDLDQGKIKENTKASGSFNFYIRDFDASEMASRLSGTNELTSRLAAIEKQLKDGRPEKPTIYEHVLDFCETPVGQAIAPQLVTAVLGMIGLIPKQAMNLGSIGEIPGTGQGMPSSIDINNDTAVKRALSILQRHDPKLSEHLTKLSTLAVNNPGAFGTLISMLDKM